ncbi:hypothetical protein KAI32_02935 [Candidatus Pacearchaeota archaeon]|nr:hypothetical protein [Candidatus Pacearchaeota archaeon]
MANKKGELRYTFIISIILGLIFIGIFFLFLGVYFNNDELDWQQCRNSIIFRANSPEVQNIITFISFKNTFPLKCKTNIVSISKKDVEEGKDGKIIADTLAQCWYMFLEGESQIFPSQTRGFESYCVPCARIRFEEDAVLLNKKIDLLKVFNGKMDKRKNSYLDYYGDGFNPSVGVNYLFFTTEGERKEFTFSGDSFYVDDESTTGLLDGVSNYFKGGLAEVNLPRYIDPSNGDVLVFVSQVVRSDGNEDLGFNPLLFYFSMDQTLDPFGELKKDFIEAGDWKASMCDTMDGVPA